MNPTLCLELMISKFACYLNCDFDNFVAVYCVSLTLLLQNMTCLVLANSVDPDQLASSEAN